MYKDMEVRFAATAFDVTSRDRSVHLTNWSQVKHNSGAACRPAELHARHPSLVKAEPAIRAVLAALMSAVTATCATPVTMADPTSEEDEEAVCCDDNDAAPRVMTVRSSRRRALFRLLAVDLMV